MDAYSQQSNATNQYSPSAAYQYATSGETQDGRSAAIYQHTRPEVKVESNKYSPLVKSEPYSPVIKAETSFSPLVKAEPGYSPMASPYTNLDVPPHSSTQYGTSYDMDVAPSLSPQGTAQRLATNQTPISARHAVSSPSTPFSYHDNTNAQLRQGQYYPTPSSDSNAMVVDTPLKRRSSGFRRVRDHRDLQPHLNSQPSGRRSDASGTMLSVSSDIFVYTLKCSSFFFSH